MKTSDGGSANRGKIGLAVALIAAAAVIWYRSNGTERAHQQEALEAVAGRTYVVKCEACQQTFEMPAADYLTQLTSEGVTCQKCGKRAARILRDAEEFDPEVFSEEASKIATVADIQIAVENNKQELDAAREALEAAETAGDSAKAAELRKKKNALTAKNLALNLRWDAIVEGHSP